MGIDFQNEVSLRMSSDIFVFFLLLFVQYEFLLNNYLQRKILRRKLIKSKHNHFPIMSVFSAALSASSRNRQQHLDLIACLVLPQAIHQSRQSQHSGIVQGTYAQSGVAKKHRKSVHVLSAHPRSRMFKVPILELQNWQGPEIISVLFRNRFRGLEGRAWGGRFRSEGVEVFAKIYDERGWLSCSIEGRDLAWVICSGSGIFQGESKVYDTFCYCRFIFIILAKLTKSRHFDCRLDIQMSQPIKPIDKFNLHLTLE